MRKFLLKLVWKMNLIRLMLIILPNISTKNRFDVLMSNENVKQIEPQKTIKKCAGLTPVKQSEYSDCDINSISNNTDRIRGSQTT